VVYIIIICLLVKILFQGPYMQIKSYLRSQNGFTPTAAIITIIVFALLVLVAITAGKPFLFSLTFNNEAKATAKNCIKKSDRILIKNVMRLARERDFVLKEKDIKIRRNEINESIVVDMKYTYFLKLPFYEENLVFENRIEETLNKGGIGAKSKGGSDKQAKETIGFFDKIKEVFGL